MLKSSSTPRYQPASSGVGRTVKVFAVDTFAAHVGIFREIPALHHGSLDDAMDQGVFVMQRFTTRANALFTSPLQM
jgi:hypothetical protein